MRRSCVFACIVAIGLATSVGVEARRGGLSLLKQRGAALLSRWQQRVLPHAGTWVQLGVAVALCTTLACGSVTRLPEVVESSAPAVSKAPDVQHADEAMFIVTKLYGKGFTAARGIPAHSIAAYENSKEYLPAQFYAGMMVYYVEDGKDFARIVDLVDDNVLKVRHIGDLEVIVDLDTIVGIMVGEHDEYGRGYIAVAADLVRPLNDDGSDQLLEALPEGITFYGVPDMIFSNGIYVVKITGFSLYSGQIRNLPTEVYFIALGEDLVPITRPAPPSTPQQRKQQFRPKREEHGVVASYRVGDGELAASLLSGTDNGVFSSK